MHCVDLGESFPTSIYLQKSASIQPRTSPSKFGGKLFNIIHSCPYSLPSRLLSFQLRVWRAGLSLQSLSYPTLRVFPLRRRNHQTRSGLSIIPNRADAQAQIIQGCASYYFFKIQKNIQLVKLNTCDNSQTSSCRAQETGQNDVSVY